MAMSATNQLFLRKFDAFVERAKVNQEQAVRAIALAILRSVVLKSPVGDPSLWKHPAPAGYVGGHFRGNWFVQEDTSPQVTDKIDNDGDTTIKAGMQQIAGFKIGGRIYILNHLPYTQRLEYEGWSSQAPSGMVRITLAEIQNYVDDVASGIKP